MSEEAKTKAVEKKKRTRGIRQARSERGHQEGPPYPDQVANMIIQLGLRYR